MYYTVSVTWLKATTEKKVEDKTICLIITQAIMQVTTSRNMFKIKACSSTNMYWQPL